MSRNKKSETVCYRKKSVGRKANVGSHSLVVANCDGGRKKFACQNVYFSCSGRCFLKQNFRFLKLAMILWSSLQFEATINYRAIGICPSARSYVGNITKKHHGKSSLSIVYNINFFFRLHSVHANDAQCRCLEHNLFFSPLLLFLLPIYFHWECISTEKGVCVKSKIY